MSAPGTLYVVATPLGNLEDVTFRAVRVLGQAALVAAEDTRRTRALLTHYRIRTPLVSYREQNHARVLPRLLETIAQGRDVALVSDAGTPGVSDPGALLVEAVLGQGGPVVPVPGPSAPACALSVAGWPVAGFLFIGFLPARKAARRQALAALAGERRTLVFFEAPHRLVEALADLAAAFGERRAVLAREMTKRHAEFLRGSLKDLAREMAARPEGARGEVTLVVAGDEQAASRRLSRAELVEILREETRPLKEIVADLAKVADMSRSDLYRLVLEVRGRAPDRGLEGGD
jgi:16S rRNA (cytidine1402-2'-O)-methyltransferase